MTARQALYSKQEKIIKLKVEAKEGGEVTIKALS